MPVVMIDGVYIRLPESVEKLERWRDAAKRDRRLTRGERAYLDAVADQLREALETGAGVVYDS